MISEEDARYLLRTPPRVEDFTVNLAQIEAWAKKQEQALVRAAQAWNVLLEALKQACREFCAKVEPDFKPFLQEVLLIASEGWINFGSWDYHFCISDDYFGKYISRRLYRGVEEQVEILNHPREWIESVLTTFYALYQVRPHTIEEGLFLRELSGEECVNYVTKVYEAISKKGLYLHVLAAKVSANRLYDKKGNYLWAAPELGLRNLEFLKNTPFYNLVEVKTFFNLPEKPRLEHQWIIAGTGAGKTQLLQRMICDDIEHGRSVVVIDSQRDMIGKLIRLKHNMEVVYIDPEDIEHPPGIALFDIKFGSGAEAEARETQVIELYEYMFSVFGAELTARQGSLFTYALRLMFVIPGANIHTLVDLFRGDKYQFKRYWEKLDSVERDFFDREFFEKKYAANREQILAKLNKILENKTLRRIFSNTQNKLDFSALLNRPVAIFINTSQDQLGENGCALFGRFLLSLITNAIVGRSKMPEEERRPMFIYVDEGRDYGNDDAFERIIYQCRKYKAGLIFCSQNIGQLSQKTVSTLFTSSIKFVRAVKEPAETRKLAQSIRVDEDFLHDLDIKDRSYAEWACKIENQKTVKATVNFGYLESQPKITEQEYQKLREENRRKYCVKAVSDGDKHKDRAEEVKPAEQKEAPKRRPEEPSARQTPTTSDPHDFLE